MSDQLIRRCCIDRLSSQVNMAKYAIRFRLVMAVLGIGLLAFRFGPLNASETYRFDFHYSVFVVSTNTWVWDEEDVNHWGSAFAIDRQGTILTANHVVKDLLPIVEKRRGEGHEAACIQVTMFARGGSQSGYVSYSMPLKIVLQRDDLDIAVLRPARPLTELNKYANTFPFETLDLDNRTVNLAEPVYIVGYPINVRPYLEEEIREFPPGSEKFVALVMHTEPIVTTATVAGISSRLGPPTAETKGRYLVNEQYFVLNHPGGNGNSGGPVISVQTGKVIGLFTRSEQRGYSFAVPAAYITAVLNDVQTGRL